MAAISIIQLDIKDAIQEGASCAVYEDFITYDTASTTSVTNDFHRRLNFRRGLDVQNPQAIWEVVLPTTYVTTTGLTLVFYYYAELPLASGAVVWEFAAQDIQASTASNVINLDAWGTPTVAGADTVPTTAGQFHKMSMALAKANIGGQVPTNGDLVRIRVRRLNTASNATDTLTGSAHIVSSLDLQTT